MPPRTNSVLDRKLVIARKVIIQLRRKLGSNLRAAGLSGSVGRGTAEKYSDIDFLLIVRKPEANRYSKATDAFITELSEPSESSVLPKKTATLQ